MSKLRILHVNDYPVEPALGGAEVVVANLIRLQREAGHAAECFTSENVASRRRTPWTYIRNAAACSALLDVARQLSPDVVHLHNYYHALSPAIVRSLDDLRQTDRPFRLIMTAHDFHLACPNSGGSWWSWLSSQPRRLESSPLSLFRLLARRWDHRSFLHSTLKLAQHAWYYRWRNDARRIDLVLCPSRAVEQRIAGIVGATHVVPNPIPGSASIARPQARPRRSDRFRAIVVGRLEPEKGVERILRAWPSDLEATLSIIGDGSQRTRLEMLAARLGLKSVIFAGRLGREETLAEIARSNLLIQRSLSLESYGLTVAEALSLGTNVLVADHSGLAEMVRSAGVGRTFDPDSPGGFPSKLRQAFEDHQAGTLNDFDVGSWLAERSEEKFHQAVLRAYGVGEPMAPATPQNRTAA